LKKRRHLIAQILRHRESKGNENKKNVATHPLRGQRESRVPPTMPPASDYLYNLAVEPVWAAPVIGVFAPTFQLSWTLRITPPLAVLVTI